MSETPARTGRTEPRPPRQEELDLLAEVVRRDDFSAFYSAEKAHLTAFLIFTGATVWEADDLAHDALIRLLPERWMLMEHPRAYLRTSAFHAYLRQGERTREVPTEALPELPGGIDPVVQVELSEQTSELVEAVGKLPPVQRTVMAFVLSDADSDEIAAALNMSLTAVYTNVCRARARLKITLGLTEGEKDA
ncbi:RNA polymerase sigma factor [Streptomyces sp. NPDC017936]|uniref:RNA polymerase sigma factor n=1 Tax=Streptomyces sp. NPDC017936 TaxID=3365016 RepID=UPI00379CE766